MRLNSILINILILAAIILYKSAKLEEVIKEYEEKSLSSPTYIINYGATNT